MARYANNLPQVISLGIAPDDASALRRISMTLRRWYELECGDGNSYASRTVARGHKANDTFEYDDTGKPYLEQHIHSENIARYSPIPDRERGAQKRLAKIMARYPHLSAYLQTDPRGCALHLLRPGDVPEGADPSCYYSRGIPVY